MALLDAVRALFGKQGTEVEWIGPTFREMILGLTPEELYRTQPQLRIVLSFVARNVAHLGLKAYERTSDTDRRRMRDDPLARLLARPNREQTLFEVLEGLASDLGLYDVAYWWLREVVDAPSGAGWEIQPIPPAWVQSQTGGGVFVRGDTKFMTPNGTRFTIPADELVVFHGWNPGQPQKGTSPVETLKQILAEQVQAWSYREQIWQRGGRVGAYITRPAGAAWSDTARERFVSEFKARWTGMDGSKAGGVPVFEDGMEMKRLGFGAREEEWSEVAKLALSTTAAVYGVNPVMVGILDNANFSNTKEFRKMLYSETLGPTLARIEDRINTFIVPRVTRTANAYVEFNIEEKLQGDFEEQAAILSTSAGAPWMTRNEVRALRNLPALAGGDELVVPLNVLTGGQASPRDSGEQNRNGVPSGLLAVKAAPTRSVKSSDVDQEEYVAVAGNVLKRFFERQRRDVLSRLGAKADWWDAARWDRELSDDLFRVAVTTSTAIGKDQAAALGFDPDDYDEDRTLRFLQAVAKSRATAINATTKDRLDAALESDEPDPAHVFDEAVSARTESGSTALVAALAGFAVMEAGKQLVGSRATKTWVVTSGNPRAEHAAMDGETVPIEENFSNGATWPGDPVLGADGVAGCMCALQLNY